MRRTIGKWIVLAPLAFLAMLMFIAIGGALVQLLWNWLLPPLFGWPALTFWQALGILALCRILFGGIGGRGGSRSNVRRRVAERWNERWDERWTERWKKMTPEERERFRQGMRERCGFDSSTNQDKTE